MQRKAHRGKSRLSSGAVSIRTGRRNLASWKVGIRGRREREWSARLLMLANRFTRDWSVRGDPIDDDYHGWRLAHARMNDVIFAAVVALVFRYRARPSVGLRGWLPCLGRGLHYFFWPVTMNGCVTVFPLDCPVASIALRKSVASDGTVMGRSEKEPVPSAIVWPISSGP
jgi:hypothetical protein